MASRTSVGGRPNSTESALWCTVRWDLARKRLFPRWTRRRTTRSRLRSTTSCSFVAWS